MERYINYVGYYKDHINYLPSGKVATPANIYQDFGYDKNPLVGNSKYKHQIEYIPLTLMDEVQQNLKAMVAAGVFVKTEKQAVSHILDKIHTYLTLALGQASLDHNGRLFDEFDGLQAKLAPFRAINPYHIANVIFETMPKLPASQVQKLGKVLEMITSLIYADALCGSIKIQNDAEAVFICKLLENNLVTAIVGKKTQVDFGDKFNNAINSIMQSWFSATNDWLLDK